MITMDQTDCQNDSIGVYAFSCFNFPDLIGNILLNLIFYDKLYFL